LHSKNKEGFNMNLRLLATIFMVSILSLAMATADPVGGTVTPGESSRGTNPGAGGPVDAQAGNVTALNIEQTRITDVWQGFYGNVSGGIVLENGDSNVFYDWSLTTVTGQVYATRSTIADWTSIACSEAEQVEAEETTLSIPASATDSISSTYSAQTHPAFAVGITPITEDTCYSTRSYDSLGNPSSFYNVMLNSDATNVVYTAILADSQGSFDGGTADFQLLVPVDRSTSQAIYYFYVELN
jgi:hypothetical protein